MIGWYAHDHGSGHRQRLECIAAQLRTPVTGLSSLARPGDFPGSWVQLPSDHPTGHDSDPTAGGTLHWAPRHHAGLRERMALITEFVARERPALMVVDVSVEVAVLVRSMGVPVVVAAMRGERTDRAHTTAYDLADALLAPWPADRPEPWPAHWLSKTWHVGAISRLDHLQAEPAAGRHRVGVLWGRGGSSVTAADIDAAAARTPAWTWDAAGLSGAATDPWRLLQDCDVVVTHGGQNALAEVAAARRPAIVIPQDRPHDEQRANARALGDLAIVRDTWPAPQDWSRLLEDACQQDVSRWGQWSDGQGAARAATRLDELAAWPT